MSASTMASVVAAAAAAAAVTAVPAAEVAAAAMAAAVAASVLAEATVEAANQGAMAQTVMSLQLHNQHPPLLSTLALLQRLPGPTAATAGLVDGVPLPERSLSATSQRGEQV